MEDGPRGIAGHIPGDGGETEKFLHREISLQQIEHLGFDLGFFPSVRQPLFPEVDGFQDDFAVTGQMIDGNAENVREHDENAGARHRLVALVFADRLRRDTVVNFGFKIAKR